MTPNRNKPIEPSIFHFIWKYSKRDQLILLMVTATLFPLLYLTLELPKRIINDAIGAPQPFVDVMGTELSKQTFLILLCFAFLISVLVHGLVKMRINTMKGVLSERMLRRFRYQLLRRTLLFPTPYFERVSQGELVSMVTSESEPMGGLMGDAISQPVLQAGQMITILGFLFLQSVWFGFAACALIPLQAWLIPRLQRRINLLNKKRIQEVRVLAGEIGESASGVSAIRAHGWFRYRLAQFSHRLGRLFAIRFDIYQKKFFMKFINNFITQLTPFFFYLIGGILVLQGQISIGALVAALAAFKDLSSPWKELLAYYNQTQDMSLRWEVVTERFAPPGMMDETLFTPDNSEPPRLTGHIEIDGVTMRDSDGNAVLEDINLTLGGGKTIAITAPSQDDRRAFGGLITREIAPAAGKVRIGEFEMDKLHQSAIAARIGYARPQPILFQGTFGENVMMGIQRQPLDEGDDPEALAESIRAGNSGDAVSADWLDPKAAGFERKEELLGWLMKLIEGMGPANALFRRGLDQSFDEVRHPELAQRLVELRKRIRFALSEAGLDKHVYYVDPDAYNDALPVSENLLFGTARTPLTQANLVEQVAFLGRIRSLQLDRALGALIYDVIDMLRRIFGRDGTDHPLFRNLGIDAKSYEVAVDLTERSRTEGMAILSDADLSSLLLVAARISADKIGPAFSDDIKARILELRKSHAAELRGLLGDNFVALDDQEFAPGLTVLENALFGKISQDAGSKADDIRKLVAGALIECGAQEGVVRLIEEMPLGLSGSGLSPLIAEPLGLCRAAFKRPDILFLDSPLMSYTAGSRTKMLRHLRELLPDTTMVCIADSFEDEEFFDVHIEIRQGRVVSDETGDATDTDGAASADLTRKLRALEGIELFSTLNRKQLRLLAFGARWYEASAGEVVFLKNAPPEDGAYLLLEGEAGLYLPQDGKPDQLIVTAQPGRLVGELGLIRNEPRALSMIAETDILCLRIGAQEFLAVVENDAATAFKLLQVVAGYVN